MTAIFVRLLEEMNNGHDAILATIVRQAGSSPRGVGAQMLVGSNGLLCGTIGGGCVEGEAIILAQALLQEKRSTMCNYRLRDDAAETVGMVCGGEITVQFQYIAANDVAWRALSAQLLQQIVRRIPGKLVLDLAGGVPQLTDFYHSDAHTIALPLPIGERVIIFGAGHCSVALSPILQTVGFRVTVVDNRPELADASRFPGADAVICGNFSRIADYLTIGEEDYVVVMTSGHTHDFTVEEQLLRGRFSYLGVIGSRGKTAAVNQMLRNAGISDAAIATIHTPIGLPIGAVTPEEIAISIAGELIQVRANIRKRQGFFPTGGCPMHA